LFIGLVILCFAEVGSRFRKTGGPYLYALESFGSVVGFQAGWLLWLSRLFAFASVCNLLVNYTSFFFPHLASGWERSGFITMVIFILALVNWAGIRSTTMVNNILAGIKVLLLLGFVIAGSFHIDAKAFHVTSSPSPAAFSMAILLLVFAFSKYGRKIDFGLRVHVIVREKESEARAYAKKLMSRFDPVRGREIKSRAQDSWSLGVQRQNLVREMSDSEGYAEPHLWTDIGKARSGAGGCLVGDPDQILHKLNRYMDMGIRAFIFSGYPLLDEAGYFARYVLPHLPNVSMPEFQGRRPKEKPVTPLTTRPLR
jgi:hypothetical protein